MKNLDKLLDKCFTICINDELFSIGVDKHKTEDDTYLVFVRKIIRTKTGIDYYAVYRYKKGKHKNSDYYIKCDNYKCDNHEKRDRDKCINHCSYFDELGEVRLDKLRDYVEKMLSAIIQDCDLEEVTDMDFNKEVVFEEVKVKDDAEADFREALKSCFKNITFRERGYKYIRNT